MVGDQLFATEIEAEHHKNSCADQTTFGLRCAAVTQPSYTQNTQIINNYLEWQKKPHLPSNPTQSKNLLTLLGYHSTNEFTLNFVGIGNCAESYMYICSIFSISFIVRVLIY